tara:strand:- start:13395 stop:15308 length:1914 start_codon:yes stop_codon:yes gene_type:complete
MSDKVFFNGLQTSLKSMSPVKSDERYFEGLLTVEMKDKQGEITIVDELYKVLPVWMDRGAPISDTHSNRIIGKGINYAKTVVKNDKGEELPAIKITGKIFKNYQLDNVIWDKIKNKEYKGLSFGGATRTNRAPIVMKDGSIAYALKDLEHYEVAVCKDPAVPMALITDVNQIAKAHHNGVERGDGKMVIQCTSMGCYVEKSSGNYVPEVDQNEEVWEKEKGVAGKGELFVPVRPSKQGSDEFDEEGNPIKKDIDGRSKEKPIEDSGATNTDKPLTAKEFPKAQKILHRSSTDNQNYIESVRRHDKEQPWRIGRDGLKEKKPPMKRRFDPKHSFAEDQDEFEDMYTRQNQILRAFIDDVEKADLGKYSTFQAKVDALVKEGYPEENAKRIVGAFVKGEKNKEADGGTVMSSDAGVNNPVYNSKDEKKRKEEDDETDKDHSNSDGESHSMFNQDVGFDRKKNYFGGIRENYDGTIKQGGMEEEETNEIHRHRENQEDEDKYDKEKEKKEKTRDLVTINQSLQKHEKTMFLKSLYKHTKVQMHCGNCGSEISLKANEIAKVGKHGVSTCPHCGVTALGVRNWGESPKNQKYKKPLREPRHGTKKQEERWAKNRKYRNFIDEAGKHEGGNIDSPLLPEYRD